MNSTQYRRMICQDIPLDDRQLIYYQCLHCSKIFPTISVFFGRPSAPKCPDCSGVLHIQGRKHLPFYQPQSDDYFLHYGQVCYLPDPFFDETILPLLSPPPKSTPQLLILVLAPYTPVHIIQIFKGFIPVPFCKFIPGNARAWRIGSPLIDQIPMSDLCPDCHNLAIDQYNQSGSLSPRYDAAPPTKLERYRKLIEDYARLGNVKLVCELNHVSRPTFYSARKRYPNLFPQSRGHQGSW